MPKVKEKIPSLTIEDLKSGQVYRSKRPKMIGMFGPLVDDRQIIHVSQFKCNMGHIDHGYTQEFEEWCQKNSARFCIKSSEIDQIQFEQETNKQAKNIETIWDYSIQYDSPSVKDGKNYPTISASKFIKWAEKNVTEIMPKGEWASTL